MTTAKSGNPLVIFEAARRQIVEAATVDQVNKVLALATGLAAAARKATDKELEAEAAVLKFEAERKLGRLMEQQKEVVGFNVGARGSKVSKSRASTRTQRTERARPAPCPKPKSKRQRITYAPE